MRLLDDLRRLERLKAPFFIPAWREEKWKAHALRIWQLLKEEMPVLLIDNVAQYYFTTSDQEHWDIEKDFPNLAPPWPMYWAEHRMPKTIHSKERGDTDVTEFAPNGRVGILAIAARPEDVKVEGTLPEGMKWLLAFELFVDYGMVAGVIDGPHGTIIVALDGEGRALEVPCMQSWAGEELEGLMKDIMAWINPLYLAVSFLHCRNVRIEEHPVDQKLVKRTRERYGITPASYKTLVIEPLKQILKGEGRSGEVGLAKAMHICRGHFRDYREGRGLFGKYHQLVWTPATVRGTKGKAGPREVEIKV